MTRALSITKFYVPLFGCLLAQAVPAQVVSEFPLPVGSALPTKIVSGPDGNLWFADYPGIGRITTSGDVTQVPIGVAVTAQDLVFDSEGNLWFTEDTKIARLARNGQLVEFSLPTGSRAFGIAFGPDGNVWFTEPANSRIGRITQSGSVAEFPVSGGPFAITAGPDGNLWFTEAGNRIGRITPTGAVTEFEVGGDIPFSGGQAITAGPDGAIWFTDPRGRIGRINTTGVISEFTIPDFQGQTLAGITLGPDGNLWFSEASAPVGPPPPEVPPSKIGRITPAGIITQFSLPNPWAYPLGITKGPDGNLWTVEFYVNKIARILPSALPPVAQAASVPTLSESALAALAVLLALSAVLLIHGFHHRG